MITTSPNSTLGTIQAPKVRPVAACRFACLNSLVAVALESLHCVLAAKAILGQRDTRKAIIVAAGRICRGPLALVASTSLPLWANRGTVLPTVALPEGGVGASREVDLQAMVTRGALDHVNQTDDRCCHGDGIHSHVTHGDTFDSDGVLKVVHSPKLDSRAETLLI